ncbi:Mitochondrial GTPase [Pseudocyphellaria aurata]|nr:Mitochondrial GTPase [Pseudocyphellaria aurata]
MTTMLSHIDLIIECRDYRVPLTSRNPLFEENLRGRERLIVFTKQDLGSKRTRLDAKREDLIKQWQRPSCVLFTDHKDQNSVRKVLDYAADHATAKDSPIGARMMVVGMPNVGKSSLLNSLRQVGMHKKKAAHTGAQPGVTRKIGTTVKIIGKTANVEGVYLVDTPGVFVPYVPNAESMLKLALCGSVKDTVISPTTLADFLLYHLNLYDPTVYAQYASPTNDIVELLEALGRKTGRLQKGGIPDVEASALWMIQRWRNGHLGKFLLDEVTLEKLEADRRDSESLGGSLSQARRIDKQLRIQRSKQRHLTSE